MSENIFDYGDITNTEKIIRSTWADFRELLGKGIFKYNELEVAKKAIFLKQFDDYFNKNNCKRFFTKTIGDLINQQYIFARGAKLKENEIADYNRFIPISTYISKDNRFSPEGIEWLYLAYGFNGNKDDRIEAAEACTVSECRAEQGQKFGICRFVLDAIFENVKLVDLTIADDLTYTQLNTNLEKYGKKVKKNMRRISDIGIQPHINQNEFKKKFEEWFSYTDAKLISEQLFEPVTNGTEKYMYAPFQCLAKYFESLGYGGILYPSTVYPQARNIVLFNKTIGHPSGAIKTFIIQ